MLIPRIAICFFGITRSLSYTINSINTNILSPARNVGEVRIFTHFFRQFEIRNPRSGERGLLRQDEYEMLTPDWLKLEEPDMCLQEWDFESLKVYGDAWKDDFQSLRNLVHQLHSLNHVTQAALAWGADIYIFVRPDLLYHDSFEKYLLTSSKPDCLFIPSWQHWAGGINDRFAITYGDSTAGAYGQRIKIAKEFCEFDNRPLHGERLLKYACSRRGLSVRTFAIRASRVRFDGTIKDEDFLDFRLAPIRKRFRSIRKRVNRLLLKRLNLRSRLRTQS